MRVKILGARQGESRGSHFASLLVDGMVALDAGGLTSALSLEEQSSIRAILLTHHHFDHIKDLASFGFNCLVSGRRGDVYCTDMVRQAAEATVLSPRIWIDFFSVPPEAPTFRHRLVEADKVFQVEGYRVHPVAVRHSIEALGYEIRGPNGGAMLYTGDSGPGSGARWAITKPDLLITECTYRNADSELGRAHGHLSPVLLAEELKVFRDARGYLPKVALVHVNPYHEQEIAAEVGELARSLGTTMWLPDEGESIEV